MLVGKNSKQHPIPYWATPSPLLSYTITLTELHPYSYWATPSSLILTELLPRPYWATPSQLLTELHVPHPCWATPSPLLSYSRTLTELNPHPYWASTPPLLSYTLYLTHHSYWATPSPLLSYTPLLLSFHTTLTELSGHRVLSRSERSGLSHSFKERSVLSRSFFWVFGKLWDPKERNVLSRSFQKNRKERKERPILLQRTGKNAKIVPFFYKERERTRERSVLLEKNTERSVLFSIYIYKYILNKYILKKERNVLF